MQIDQYQNLLIARGAQISINPRRISVYQRPLARAQRIFFDPATDGSIRLRVQTEPGFTDVVAVFNDGEPKAEKLHIWGETDRFQFWEGEIRPQNRRFRYHIALRRADGKVAYHGPTGITGAAEYRFQVNLDEIPPFETPDWAQGAVIYQIFPERFANGNPALTPPNAVPWGTLPQSFHFQGGDLIGIHNNLDYLADLGVDALYLNPIFTSPSNHKYDCSDYYHVDPAFGGNPAFADLVKALHQRGMKIILDASFNHCHPSFFAFQDILENGPDSSYWDWFTIHEWPLQARIRPHRFPPDMQARAGQFRAWFERFERETGIPVVTVDDDGPLMEPTYQAWMGVLNMPKINLQNPAARNYFLDVTRYWIEEFDIDGWRMDVVPFVDLDFWEDFRQTAKRSNPNVVLLAEIWGNASLWLDGSRFDATMNYTFRTLALEYFAKASLETSAFLDGIKTMLQMYTRSVMLASQNLISSHDVPRFLHEAGEDIHRLRLASLFQLTMPGAPGIYYGDEIGLSGAHDPDNRRAFPWDARDRWDMETLAQIRALIHLRKASSALRIGDWEVLWADKEAFAYRRFDRRQQVVVVIARQQEIKNAQVTAALKSPRLVFGQADFRMSADGLEITRMPAWSGAVFVEG